MPYTSPTSIDKVPYVGAIQALDLGSQNISTTGLGTFDDLKIATSGGIYPASDSTIALYVFKADGSTPVITVDTTNSIVSFANDVKVADDVRIGGAAGNASVSIVREGTQTFRAANNDTAGVNGGAGFQAYNTNAGSALGSGHRAFFFFGGGISSSSTVRNAMGFQGIATEAWNAGGYGCELQFLTTANNDTTRTNRLTIESDGGITVEGDNAELALGAEGASDSFLRWDGSGLDRFSSGGIFNYQAGANTNITLNFEGTTNSGVMKWMEALDYFRFDNDVVFNAKDVWWIGDGSGIPYGGCFGNEITFTIVNPGANNWTDIEDTDMTDGELNLVTHDGSGELTVTKAGRYHIIYTVTFESSVANKHVQTAISINGTALEAAGINHIEISGVGNEVVSSGNAILDLAASTTIEVALRTTDAGNVTFTVDHLNITLSMVGGT